MKKLNLLMIISTILVALALTSPASAAPPATPPADTCYWVDALGIVHYYDCGPALPDHHDAEPATQPDPQPEEEGPDCVALASEATGIQSQISELTAKQVALFNELGQFEASMEEVDITIYNYEQLILQEEAKQHPDQKYIDAAKWLLDAAKEQKRTLQGHINRINGEIYAIDQQINQLEARLAEIQSECPNIANNNLA